MRIETTTSSLKNGDDDGEITSCAKCHAAFPSLAGTMNSRRQRMEGQSLHDKRLQFPVEQTIQRGTGNIQGPCAASRKGEKHRQSGGSPQLFQQLYRATHLASPACSIACPRRQSAVRHPPTPHRATSSSSTAGTTIWAAPSPMMPHPDRTRPLSGTRQRIRGAHKTPHPSPKNATPERSKRHTRTPPMPHFSKTDATLRGRPSVAPAPKCGIAGVEVRHQQTIFKSINLKQSNEQ